ncbi:MULTISPECIES: SOS response-associated peptidase [unclassified Methylobacterium]|uniref:SOS response-associated peptidase n=1 Tax=unclassified Methylobacterium TaxID=2615210 RepID=UPI0011C1EB6C|nr:MULTISPECIES: SOS response-associated peptidase [unclassified Methylobacterium]QEE41931.1 SOS response-associated peptidase [Methylobacterium sp. WL1]TXN02341.1 SOS response-associated peptidase [Methylobacterium sp. WL64]TXN54708.1 SOS response-associated peptidase [Methylobacterium sp. WL2]
MCNLYSLRTGPAGLRRAFETTSDRTGNLPPLPAIFPDQMAPVVWNGAEGRELALMRWGIPGPKAFGEHPVTNVRNAASPHWRPWLGPAHRCLVPANAFSEYADTKPRKIPVWFARDEDRPLFAFAGIWRSWTGVRGTKRENPDRVPEEHRLFSFLTTEANGVVGPVHPKAMPVVLTEPEEWAAWLEAPTAEALKLQRPLPDSALREVARGERSDGAAPDAEPEA